MCNPRRATLPAIVAASPNKEHLRFWLARSSMKHPLRTLLRELFVDPVLRLLRNRRARTIAAVRPNNRRRSPLVSGAIRKKT